ncbi:MAG: acyltransferase [Eubacterium sp.]|nr:acyltransferase [Eubacterium sp.]
MMLLIIAHHFVCHGSADFESDLPAFSLVWLRLLEMGGKIGVNVFVLISGYFLIEAKSFKISKIVKLWLQVFFYSALLFCVTIYITKEFHLSMLPNLFLPISFRDWWFVSAYFVMYLISPLLNKALNSLSKKQYLRVIIVAVVMWSVIPTLFNVYLESNSLLWFITLYAIAGYIRKFNPFEKYDRKLFLFAAVVLAVVSLALRILLFDILDVVNTKFQPYVNSPYNMQYLLTLLISICIFVYFSKLDIQYNKAINTVSSTTFAIYLIHDYPSIREYLWNYVFVYTKYLGSIKIIPYSIIVVLLIFVFCAVIELIRQNLIERFYVPYLSKLDKFSVFNTA